MQASADRAKEIFLHALELAGEEARSAYLETVCGTDAELRKRVENLLRSHRPEDSFLDPRKLHGSTPSGHTQTSDFADTSTSPRARQSKGPINELKPWLTASTQPNSLGRFLHYELLEELGQGGFGIVYRVFDEKLHRVVALKILSPALASNSTARQRFLREARAAAAVRHEHVISIHAVDDEPLPHLVMEFISGQTLQQKIDKVGTLRLKEILRIGMQMAQGLEAAHKQGLIHRDIKPSNILLENGIERVKISDFGLARAVDDTSISHQGMIVGTPSFMSPEQAEGKPVDARSDLFSLGSTLYAMCTGQSPFQGSSTIAVLKMVVEATPSPITMLNQELPGWLDEIVSKLLAKNPQDRFASASEVAALLQSRLADIQLNHVQPANAISRRAKNGDNQVRFVFMMLGLMIVAGILVYYFLEVQPEEIPPAPPMQPAASQTPDVPVISAKKPIDEPRLLKRYDPKVDRPIENLAKLSLIENGTVWRWENIEKDRGFTVAFDPILQNLPTEGVIICKLKVRMTKHHKDTWGDLLLDTHGPSHFGYEWPLFKYRFSEETPDFIEREIRYPAHAFYQKSPPLLMVQIGLYGQGVLEAKELELWYLPDRNGSTAKTIETRQAVSKLRLLKVYDPRTTQLTPQSLNSVKMTVLPQNKGWHWEGIDKEYGYTIHFDPCLENIPKDGLIICKAKVKLKKSHVLCQGNMTLNGLTPSTYSYDWPQQQFCFMNDDNDFVQKEVRYPAHIFHLKNPPQFTVQFQLLAAGTLEIKDVEVWHQPGANLKATDKTNELQKLVDIAQQFKLDVEKQYQHGLVAHDKYLMAEVKWLQARVSLAEDRQNWLEVIDCLNKIKGSLQQQLSLGEERFKAGLIRDSDLTDIKESIVKIDARLKAVMQANRPIS